MKRDILISIKPKYAEAILNGEKRYEFRKRIPKHPVDRVYVYATHPVKKVIGSFTVEGVITASPIELWKRCQNRAGISKKAFFEYFHGRDIGHALKIGEVNRWHEPLNIWSPVLFIGLTPPQSFCYIGVRPKRYHNHTPLTQVKNPRTGRYIKINRATGTIVSHKPTKGPYKGVPIVAGLTASEVELVFLREKKETEK